MKITASKITAGKKEDILRRKAEYEAKRAEYDADRKQRQRNYNEAYHAVTDPIKHQLESDLSQFNLLQFDVTVEDHYTAGVRVRISCNEHRKFDEQVALAWSYEASLTKTGDVKRESSSWSGMSAVTPEQVESLKQTAAAVEYLLNVDWATILNVALPDLAEFYKDAIPAPTRENFDEELAEAELEEFIGTDQLVKVQNFESSGYRGQSVYVRILRETPSQYVVNILTDWDINNIRNGYGSLDSRYTQRVRKSSIVPITENGHIVTTTI